MKVELKLNRVYRLQKERECIIMKKATKKNVSRDVKKHNFHAMFFAVVIIAVFFMFVHVETATYIEITNRRSKNAENLEWRTADIADIQKESEQCAQDLEILSARSPLGEILVKNDKTQIGHFRNYLILYGSRCFACYCAFYVVRDMIRWVKFLIRKGKKYYLKSNEQLKALSDQ